MTVSPPGGPPVPLAPQGRRSKCHAWPLLLAFAAMAPALAAPGELLRTSGHEIVASAPEGKDWSCSPSRRAGEGFTLAEIRCRLPLGQGALLLYAKDYDGPSETTRGICARDWKAYYSPILATVDRVAARVVGEGARSACEVDASGTATDGTRIRLREWYAVAPRHVLLVTAAGPADVMSAEEQVVARWRNGVVFRAAR